MAMSLSIEKAKVSKLKRLKMLPRIGFTIDVAGYQLSYRNVPITETIINLFDTRLQDSNSLKRLQAQLTPAHQSANQAVDMPNDSGEIIGEYDSPVVTTRLY
jgi:hypothetical protein